MAKLIDKGQSTQLAELSTKLGDAYANVETVVSEYTNS